MPLELNLFLSFAFWLGLAFGALAASVFWLWSRNRILGRALSAEATLAAERAAAGDRFRLLAEEVMAHTAGSFGARAEEDHAQRRQAIESLLEPIKQKLGALDQDLRGEGQARAALQEILKSLRSETTELSRVLKNPGGRGRWGEVQLRRIAELSGMLIHCDFREQAAKNNPDSGTSLRPDMVVTLPGGRQIVVDSKVPMEAFSAALEAEDDAARRSALTRHAAAVREYSRALSAKGYWEAFAALDFVVLFLPGESFLSAALEADPGLLESCAEKNVILATPSTLLALLRAVAYGWRQEQIAAHAEDIRKHGAELYKRLADVFEHLRKLGVNLGRAVSSYNETLGSFERRLTPAARRMEELGIAAAPLESLEPLTSEPRRLSGEAFGIAALPLDPVTETPDDEKAA